MNSKPAGNDFEISLITLSISALTSVALAPGACLTMNMDPGCPSTFERKEYVLVPNSTSATSLKRKTSPPEVARRMISPNSLISSSCPLNSMSILFTVLSMLPTGDTMCCSLMALIISSLVTPYEAITSGLIQIRTP